MDINLSLTLKDILSIIGTLIALAGVLWRVNMYFQNIQNRLSVIETKVDVWWKSLEENLSDFIHSPHTPYKDSLLEALHDDVITSDQVDILINIMEEELASPLHKHKPVATIILLSRLKSRASQNHGVDKRAS